jgi:hypothetical protein
MPIKYLFLRTQDKEDTMTSQHSSQRINTIETTPDTISGRGGLALFSRYLEQCGIFALLETTFGKLRKSAKGLAVWGLFKQIFCFLCDGTSRHISYFDHLKQDDGYTATLELSASEMASSHAIKRFFQTFGWWCGRSFRWILGRLFVWRLKQQEPDIIELYVDTMVMDNDEATKRHGVQPTYKNVKGFHPLQILWEGKVVDGIFRGGKKHGNANKTVANMIIRLVSIIRREYREEVTMIVRCDSGFFDEANFAAFDALNIGFIANGKMYKGVKEQVETACEKLEDVKEQSASTSSSESPWNTYDNGHQRWSYLEFGFKCDSWDRFYRAIYTRPQYDDDQMLLEFARPENVMLTNIGINDNVLKHCSPEQQEYWLDARTLIGSYHQCGKDELTHRGLKDFGFEQLPFKRFGANTALYYCMLIAFFLFETFKEDVLHEVIPLTSYATTVRRQFLDIAAKIVKTGHIIILKVSQPIMNRLQLDVLWQKCQNPPPLLL